MESERTFSFWREPLRIFIFPFFKCMYVQWSCYWHQLHKYRAVNLRDIWYSQTTNCLYVPWFQFCLENVFHDIWSCGNSGAQTVTSQHDKWLHLNILGWNGWTGYPLKRSQSSSYWIYWTTPQTSSMGLFCTCIQKQDVLCERNVNQ